VVCQGRAFDCCSAPQGRLTKQGTAIYALSRAGVRLPAKERKEGFGVNNAHRVQAQVKADHGSFLVKSA
jgi:hypothetical protein